MAEFHQKEIEDYLSNHPEFVLRWLNDRNKSLNQKEKTQYQASNDRKLASENEIYKESLKDVAYLKTPVYNICHNILRNICISLKCERACLFLICGPVQKLHIVSKLIDVTPTSIMEQTLHTEENAIRIPYGKGILGYVAEHNCLVTSEDPYNDPRFTNEIDIKMDRYTRNMITTPVTNVFGIVVGVTQVINKKDGKPFTEVDENIARSFSSICGISLDNEQFLEMTQEEFQRHQLILKVAKCILKEQVNLKKLISEILRQAREMLHCSKIIVYLTGQSTDPATPTTSSDVYQLLQDEDEVNIVPLPSTYIGPIDDNLKGNRTINTVNLQLTSAEMLVAVEEDVSNWLVCMSMTNYRSKVVGCILFVRSSEHIFSQSDINTMEIFAKLCGVGIYNCQLHERSVRVLQQREVMNEVLAFYTTCDQNSLDKILKLRILSAKEYGIHSFDFDDSNFSENETVLICVRIFLEKNALSILNVPIDVLYRFILTAKKNHRPNIYHNWRHGVKVCQSMYLILNDPKIKLQFTELEQIFLQTVCLLHLVDHRGNYNTIKKLSLFFQLYKELPLIYHRIDRAVTILGNTETNIFRNLPAETYKYGLKFIEKAILATDVEESLAIIKDFNKHESKLTESNFCDIDLLIKLVVAASVRSAAGKPWFLARRSAVTIAAEFFYQTCENKYNEHQVYDIVDKKTNKNFPNILVNIFDSINTPLYEVLSDKAPHLMPFYKNVLANRHHWYNISKGIENFAIDLEIESLLYNGENNHEVVREKKLPNIVSTQTSFIFDEHRIISYFQLVDVPCQTETRSINNSYFKDRNLVNALNRYYKEKLIIVKINIVNTKNIIEISNKETQVIKEDFNEICQKPALIIFPGYGKTLLESIIAIDDEESSATFGSPDLYQSDRFSTFHYVREEMSEGEKERIATLAIKEIDQLRKRTCVKKVKRKRANLNVKLKTTNGFLRNYVCSIS